MQTAQVSSGTEPETTQPRETKERQDAQVQTSEGDDRVVSDQQEVQVAKPPQSAPRDEQITQIHQDQRNDGVQPGAIVTFA